MMACTFLIIECTFIGEDDDFSSFQTELNLPLGSSVFFSPSYQANSDSETDVEPRKTRFSVKLEHFS